MPKKEKSQLRERVESFIKGKGLSVRAFELSLDLPNGTVSQYKDSTSRDTLQKIKDKYEDFDIDYVISGRECLDVNIYTEKQPILDIRVCAGNGIGLEGAENKIVDWVSIPEFHGCKGITVYGDSMYDRYKSGDVVFVRRILEKNDIDFGQCYVVITREDRYIKSIYESEKGEEYVSIVSYNTSVNPDGRRKYPDRNIQLNDILFLYKVIGNLRRTQL